MDGTSSDEEEENCIRLFLLLNSVAPKSVRTLFDQKAPSTHLPQLLQNNKSKLLALKSKGIIYQSQWDILFPQNTTQNPESSQFDVTLMICLLRNLKLVKEPPQGFDRLPGKPDKSEGADLARIKYYMNNMAHIHNIRINSIDFEIQWFELSNAIIRITGSKMKTECEHLKQKNLDKNVEKLKKEMKNFPLEIGYCNEAITDVRSKLDYSLDRPSYIDVEQQRLIQESTKEIDSNTYKQWVKDNERFVETNAVRLIIQELENHNFITVTGVAGIGKTTTLRHVALYFKNKGYAIVPIKSPLEIVGSKILKIFVMDNTCGESAINLTAVDMWLQYESNIRRMIKSNRIKVITSSILHVFKEKQFQKITLLSKYVCNLSEQKYRWSFQDEVHFMANYLKPKEVISILTKKHQHDISVILPFLSFFGGSKKEIMSYLINSKSISDKIGKLKEDKEKYCALFLFVVKNGYINESYFRNEQGTDSREEVDNIFEDFGISRGTPKGTIKEKLDAFIGTYLEKIGPNYLPINTAIFDAFCVHYSQEKLETLLTHADSKLLSERLHLNSIHEFPHAAAIIVPEEKETIYFDRILRVMLQGQLCNLFSSKQMADPLYRLKLKSCILKLDYASRKKLLNTEDKEEKHVTLLYLVCQLGYTDLVLLALDYVSNINSFTNFLPLNAACSNGFINIAKLLMKKGCNVTTYDNKGFNSLLEVCKGGYINIAKLLLNHGANINARNPYGLTSLMIASSNGQTKTVNFLISQGALINNRCKLGATSLMLACSYDHNDVVELLLLNRADVNMCTVDKLTALMVACQHNNMKIVDLLIASGADVNHSSITKTTPLMLACVNGCNEAAAKLITCGAKPDQPSLFGTTALNAACSSGHLEIARLLLSKGADIENKCVFNISPLAAAARSSNEKIVKLLLENGAKINVDSLNVRSALTEACLAGEKSMVDLLIKSGAKINYPTYNDMTPLMAACFTRNKTLVKYLIDIGAKVNETNEKGWNALFEASRFNNVEIIKILIENDVDINVSNHLGVTPMMCACFYENIAVFGLLRKYDASLTSTDKYGLSILSIASRTGSKSFLKWIIDNISDTEIINQKDQSGCTPLMHACSVGHLDKTELLIEKGAITDIKDINGWTSLMWATHQGSVTLVDFLISKGQRFDDVEINGCSSLSIAAYLGHLKTIELLLLKGAVVNHRDNDGWTPLMWACKGRHMNAAKLFLDYGADINLYDDDQKTPLLWACEEGEDDIVDLIISQCRSDLVDNTTNLWVTLMWSAKFGKTKIVHDCIRLGVDVNKANNDGITPLIVATSNAHYEIVRLLVRSNGMVTKLDNQGWSALRWAAQLSLQDIFVFLLFNGACITGADWLPMILWSSRKRFTKLLNTFVEQGVNLNCVDGEGRSPLFLSCIAENYDQVSILLDNGADSNQADNRKRTPLLEISTIGNVEIFQLLMKYNANILLRDCNMNTCLIEAVKGGHKTIINVLIDNGAVILHTNKRLWTAREEARWRGYTEIVKILEEKQFVKW